MSWSWAATRIFYLSHAPLLPFFENSRRRRYVTLPIFKVLSRRSGAIRDATAHICPYVMDCGYYLEKKRITCTVNFNLNLKDHTTMPYSLLTNCLSTNDKKVNKTSNLCVYIWLLISKYECLITCEIWEASC